MNDLKNKNNSKIDDDMASIISVAAQAPNNSDSLEAVSFKAFHKNIKNRFTDSLLDPAERFEEFSEAMEVAKVELELDLTNFSKMFRQLNQYQVWSNNQYRVTMGKQEAAKSGRRSNINSDSAIALAKDLENNNSYKESLICHSQFGQIRLVFCN